MRWYPFSSVRVLVALVCVVVLVPALPVTVRASGLSVTVNTVQDLGSSRVCTFRNAIDAINAGQPTEGCATNDSPDGNRIVIAFMSGVQTLSLERTLPPIVRGVTITAATQLGYVSGGEPVIHINGLESFPIFTISDVLPASETVTLDALSITGGKAASCAAPGGGIVNRGRLVVTRSVIAGNFGCAGSGIGNSGTLTVENSAIRDNGAAPPDSGNAATYGGGLHTSGGTTTLTNVSFTGNAATADGGAIHATAPVTLTNVTIAGNTAGGNGGGVYASLASSAVTLGHVTLTGNRATDGGGLYRVGVGGTFSLSRSVVAENIATGSGGATDARGTFVGAAYNFIGRTDGGTGFSGTDTVGTAAQPRDALLLTPGDHGGDGPVRTFPPRPDSPLVDAAPCLPGVGTDARGTAFARPQGAACDIGAFEVRHIPVTPGSGSRVGNALAALPANSGSVILDLAAGTYTERVTLPALVAVGVVGEGAATTVLDGGGSGPVVSVSGGFATLARVTVRGGAGSNVGGVRVTGGTLSLAACVVRDHMGDYMGATAAIENTGALHISGCTITANTRGGGIANNGTMTVTNSTISGNTTANMSRAAAITNGAGSSTARLTLLHSTVVGNTAPSPDPGRTPQYRAGVQNIAGSTTVTASIIAGNALVPAMTADDVLGAFTSGGGNVIGSVAGGTGFGGTDVLPAPGATLDAKLLPLAVNAPGTTPTHAPRPNSPALDAAGGCAAGVSTDQRGLSRPRGAACDTGAYEYTPVTPTLAPATAPRAGGSVTFTGTGFQRGTTVSVGGTSAPVTAVNDSGTSLTATVPSHTAGDVSLVATNPGGLMSVASTFTYQSGAAMAFTLSVPTGTVQAGTPQTVIVTARDGEGAVATGYRGTVRLQVSGGVAELPAPYTFTAGDDGTHTFTVTFRTVRSVTVTASDTTNTALSGTSANVSVAPGVVSLGPSSGPVAGGTRIVVRGAGFTAGGTTVRVDGVALPPASVVVVSDGELSVTMPARMAGSVGVTVTVGGLTTTAPGTYTYGVIHPAAMPRAAAPPASVTPRPAPLQPRPR